MLSFVFQKIPSRHLALSVGLCILILSTQDSLSQEVLESLHAMDFRGDTFDLNPNFTAKEFPEEAYFTDAKFKVFAAFDNATFNSNTYFFRTQFDDFSDFKEVEFHSRADFRHAKFLDIAYFEGAKFKGTTKFSNTTFDSTANFSNAQFGGDTDFRQAKFNSYADFTRVIFDTTTIFGRGFPARFLGEAYFSDSKFHNSVYFSGVKFERSVYFDNATFYSETEFGGAEFRRMADFSGAKFDSMVYFGKAKFNETADFTKVSFVGEVDFSNTDFRQGVDFRQTNFDSVNIILLEDIKFPVGKLLIYWDQFKKQDHFRIRLFGRSDNPMDDYTRIEIIYHQLRNNFLSQDDKLSADYVMYELGLQRDDFLKEFWWRIYGWILGYGYQPWRFLFFVVMPVVVIFVFVWYFAYYDVLQYAIFQETKSRSKKLGASKVSPLLKTWHATFFSFSVLLGIRFKKEWLVEHRNYLFWVTFQWVLGVGLFILFAVLSKGSRFAYVKGLFGF